MQEKLETPNGIREARPEVGGLSLKDAFYKYVRFTPVLILSVGVFLLGAWLYLRYTTQIYGTGGTMLIKSANGPQQDKVEDILTGNTRAQNIQDEIEVLRSRPLMTRVVRKLALQYSYTSIGKIKEINVYKGGPFVIEGIELKDSAKTFELDVKFLDEGRFRINDEGKTYSYGDLFETAQGKFRLRPTGGLNTAPEYKVTWRPAETVALELVKDVRVVPKTPGSSILTVSVEATNGQMAADIANALMVQYDSLTIEQNNYSTDQMVGFIDERLLALKTELDSAQLQLVTFRQRNNLVDVNLQSNSYFQGVTETENAAYEQQMRLNIATMLQGYLNNKQNEFNNIVVPSSLGLEDATLNELVNGYNKAQLDRQTLLQSGIPAENPAVKQADALIEKQRQSVLENLQNIKSAYLSTIGMINRRTAERQSQISSLPAKLKELIEMERQINTKLSLYTLLEEKREEAAISRAATISSSKIIEPARASFVPTRPNRRGVQAIAILLGIGLPAIIIFLIELTNDKVNTRADVERLTSIPILGEVGHSFSEKVLIVHKTSRSMVAEQFRIIRSNLQYVISKTPKPVIMVTSSFSGEGKSFISTNMGSVMSLTGKKTVILEFDIRKPKVMSGLSLGKKPGISNYMLGNAELKDLIIPVPEYENLFVLPCGPIPPNPSELLLDEKIDQMFGWLKENFDVVVIDTAPVGMVSDAMTLGKYADCTIYLVRQGRTFRKQISNIDELYREHKLPRLSIVINDVKLKAGYGYYGYGRYGYGYGYGQKPGEGYYEEEKVPPGILAKLSAALNPLNWFRKK